jgi:transposase
MANNISETIGCDLGNRRSAICVLDAGGNVKLRTSVRTTRAAMASLFTRARAHVVIEVGAHSRWVNVLLKELGHDVTVANPRRVKLISESDNKDDPQDAELLARLGRADVKLLAPVKHRGMDTQADLAVVKSRDVLVASRTKLINHVRGIIKSFGEQLPKCTTRAFGKRTRELVPVALKAALMPIYDALETINKQIDEQDKMLERIAKRYPDVEAVSQPKGVATVTALGYLLTLEDKDRFATSRDVGSFIGLRPRKHKSSESNPQLRITKAGDPLVRRLLVNAANYILGPFGADSDLRRWGLQLASRGGKNAKKRATVAVARKLAVLMHRLWVTGEAYEPLGYHQRRMEQRQAA